MKKLILFLLMALSISGLRAQSFWDSQRPDRAVTVGLRAGLSSSKQYATDFHADQDAVLGWQAGVAVDVNIIRSFSVNTGLMLIKRGWKNTYSDNRGSLETTDNAMYVELPLLASYRMPLSDQAEFQLNLGPYFAYGIGGKRKTTNSFQAGGDYEIDCFDSTLGCKHMDCGISVGVAFTFLHFYAGVNYERGLVNTWEPANYKYQNGCIALNLGYNF